MSFDIFKIADDYHQNNNIPKSRDRPNKWSFDIDNLIDFHSDNDEYIELVNYLLSVKDKDKTQKTIVARPSDDKAYGLLKERTGSGLWIFGPAWYIENCTFGLLYDFKLFTESKPTKDTATKPTKKKKKSVKTKMGAAIYLAGIKGREVAHVVVFEIAKPESILKSVIRFGAKDTFKSNNKLCVGMDAAHTYWHSL